MEYSGVAKMIGIVEAIIFHQISDPDYLVKKAEWNRHIATGFTGKAIGELDERNGFRYILYPNRNFIVERVLSEGSASFFHHPSY